MNAKLVVLAASLAALGIAGALRVQGYALAGGPPLEPRHTASVSEAQETANTLTPAEEAEGWRLLFDGHSVDGWRGYGVDSAPAGWVAVDGTLSRAAGTEAVGDLITTEQFEDFELSLEWRIESGGNSGIFYRAAEGLPAIYQGAPEMQVLDDAGHPDGASPLTSAGSNFGLYGVAPGIVRPAGQWNHARIVVRGDHVEHWLNGVRVIEYQLASPDWESRVAASKFADWPAYGRAETGHIGLQDHGDPVWFRNVKVLVIDPSGG